MANNIKGITIQIGGETTGLDKALEGVNKEAQKTRDELKEINKALKFDPGNTELLEQKQRALAEAVRISTERVNMLKQAQKEAAEQLANGSIGQEQIDALNRELVNAEGYLKKDTEALNAFKESLNKTEEASDHLGEKLGDVSSKAQAVADKTKALSAAASGLLVAMGAAALKSAAWADDLNTLSKQTGLTTEELQKMEYASELVDVSVDTIAGSMSKMRRAMDSTSEGTQQAFAQIGVSVRDSSGQLRDSSEVFYEVLEGLSRVGNETERDTLAMQIFGKSADQLAGIIDDGGASLKALGDEAANLGLVLDQETLDAMNRVNDTIDRLKAQAKADFIKAGASALEALTPVIEDVVSVLSKVLDFIGNLNPKVIEAVAAVALVVASISPIAGAIAKVSGALSTLVTMFPAIGTFLAALPGLLPIAGIIAIGVAVAELANIIYQNWDKIKAKLQDVKDWFVGLWEAIVDAFKETINMIIALVNKGIEAINSLIEKINNNAIAKFFGVGIKSIGTIPALAGGGSLSSGTALVGENGPEVLTMSNGRANVTPLHQTTNTYNTINQTSRQPVQVVLDVNGIQLARALYDPLKQVSKQIGPSFVTE